MEDSNPTRSASDDERRITQFEADNERLRGWLGRIEQAAGFGPVADVAAHQAGMLDTPIADAEAHLRERRVRLIVDEVTRYQALVADADGTT